MNLYETLGVRNNASEKMIKDVFRRKVKKVHPDHNGGQHSQAFLDLMKAYGVLSNAEKRKKYDQFGIISDDEAGQITEKAVESLKNLFMTILAQIDPDQLNRFNFVDAMRESIDGIIAQARAKMQEIEKQELRLTKCIKTVQKGLKKQDKKKPDIFTDALQHQINSLKPVYQKYEDRVKFHVEMTDILVNYQFEIFEDCSSTLETLASTGAATFRIKFTG